jgi:hypothetical protein
MAPLTRCAITVVSLYNGPGNEKKVATFKGKAYVSVWDLRKATERERPDGSDPM